MTNTSGLIKSLNKAVANFYLKHSEESLLYLQAFFKAGHMLCCALLQRVKNSLHSSGFSFSLFCLDYFHTWRVFRSHLRSSMRGQPVQECILMPPLSTVLMHVPLLWWFLANYWIWVKISLQRPKKCNFQLWSAVSSDCMSIGASAEGDTGSRRQPFTGSPMRLP